VRATTYVFHAKLTDILSPISGHVRRSPPDVGEVAERFQSCWVGGDGVQFIVDNDQDLNVGDFRG